MTFAFALILIPLLVFISYVDVQKFIIPNILNVAMFAFGCAWVLTTRREDLIFQLVSSLCLFLSIYFVKVMFLKVSGRDGIGSGDIKFIGASGLWISPYSYPLFICLASGSGLLFLLLFYRHKSSSKLAFGPFLAFSLGLVWLKDLNFL